MNIILSSCLRSLGTRIRVDSAASSWTQLRSVSSLVFKWTGEEQRTLTSKGSWISQSPPWHYQQVRWGKRGTEYQPKNLKRKRTHGWIKRISTQGGIEVILRRMLKGRKSLSH
ncbi:39S ribosomal protein L34, mitochondrial [Trichomycterus rosablanca]|uniref:39S ribosomal protein L34, mitochondrial n=1 Tax=Trichomycterus rosablanca TaxID=2290929 RepID=UPI002F350083